MGRSSPFVVSLSDEDRLELERRVRRGRSEHRAVERAQIVLLAADGATNVEIARRLRIVVNTVSTWRKRFVVNGLSGLRDLDRSGRPKTFGTAVVAAVSAIACELPAKRNLPLSRFSSCQRPI